jgi:hypothetical protein
MINNFGSIMYFVYVKFEWIDKIRQNDPILRHVLIPFTMDILSDFLSFLNRKNRQHRDISHFFFGRGRTTRLLRSPRTDPSVRNYRTRLLPRIRRPGAV